MLARKLLPLLLLILVLPLPSLAVGYDTQGIGARPLGMGKAFAGVANDVSCISFNPAGLAQIKSLQLLNMYTTPFPNNSLIVFSAAYPLEFLGVTGGFSYANNTTTGIKMSLPATVEFSYTEQEFLFSFAGWSTENIATAMTINLITKAPSISSPLLKSISGSGFDMDMGIHYQLNERVGLGLALQNILPAFMGGRFVYDNQGMADLPSNLKLGTAVAFPPNWRVMLDVDRALTRTMPNIFHLGTEWQPSEALAVRAGIDQVPKDFLTATETYNNYTFGIGLKYQGVTFDYTYYRNGVSDKVTNYFALGYITPEPPKPAPPTPVVTEKVLPLSELLPPRIRIVAFSDVPAGDPAREAIELMATAGIFPGYADGTFKPRDNFSRAAFRDVLLAARHVERIAELDKAFAGLKLDQPVTRAEAGKALMLFDRSAVKEEIDRPDDPATRAELAQMLMGTSFGKAAAKRLR
jgi:hypothetical protein